MGEKGQHQVVFDEILRGLEVVEGFILVPVEVSGPKVIRDLARWLEQAGREPQLLELEHESIAREVAVRLFDLETTERSVVLVVGPERPTAALRGGLRILNQRRDTLIQKLRCPLLWCGSGEILDTTWEEAPDFWSVRALGHKFGESPLDLERAKAWRWEWALEEPPERLEALLEHARSTGDRPNAARIAVQLADLLLVRGEVERADAVLQEALDASRQGGRAEERSRGQLLRLQADVLASRGELDAAERIYVEELLPLHERLRDDRERALTKGKISDILEARGQLDEVLRIRREDRKSVL